MRRLAGLVAVVTAMAGCSAGSEGEVTVLAAPELADVVPLLGDLERDTGVRLRLDLRNERLEPGRYRHDMAWPSSDRYFRLMSKGTRTEPPSSTTTMFSPVVIGLKPAVAARLSEASWADIADEAAQGRLRFAMADPRIDGGGLAALVGVATAAGAGVLRPETVTCDRLRGFFTGHTLTSAAAYVAREGEADGLVAHESTLLTLNGRLEQPLEIVYPRDGMVMSDYPLMLLNPARRAAYDKVVAWLKRDSTQQKIMRRTLRRPLSPGVTRDPRLKAPVGNALPFPGQREVVDTLLANYADPARRRPDRVVFLLDFSGSMRGARIEAVKAAFDGLGGADDSAVGRFVRFHRGERITVVRFGGRVMDERTFTAGEPGAMERLRDHIGRDDFDGSTAIWSALRHAYSVPDRTSIVLMTDGRNNSGLGLDAFLKGDRPRAVPTFAIGFGDADRTGLRRAATATGGRFVDGDTRTSLLEALKEIRGCR